MFIPREEPGLSFCSSSDRSGAAAVHRQGPLRLQLPVRGP